MKIHIQLHGILRDRLPSEAKGQTALDLPEGATTADLIAALGLEDQFIHLACNETMLDDTDTVLSDGNHIEIFLPSAGG